jgi:hypothetical protein
MKAKEVKKIINTSGNSKRSKSYLDNKVEAWATDDNGRRAYFLSDEPHCHSCGVAGDGEAFDGACCCHHQVELDEKEEKKESK